ncbi:MAG: CHAT domain-containing protein [Gemmatimonadota bacterium]
MRYQNFDLWIEPDVDGGLRLRSCSDCHGEYPDTAALDADAVRRTEVRLADTKVAPETLVDFGKLLYAATFASRGGQVEWHFAQCLGATSDTGDGVRVRLRVAVPALAVIPWEFLYSEKLHGFLGVSVRTPIVRYVELPRPIGLLETTPPVRMLVVIPAAGDLATEVEKVELLKTLEPLKNVVTTTVLDGAVARDRLAAALAAESFQLLHFIGHGDFDGEAAVLALNGEDGEPDLVDAAWMTALLRNHPSMKLVVLNSCRGGEVSPIKPFVGMAESLVREGVPAVIAMQYAIHDREAITFSRVLYRYLFASEDKGRIEVALTHARNALSAEFPQSKALGLPVLFTHAREGVLFNVVSGGTLAGLPISRAALTGAEALRDEQANDVEAYKSPGVGSPEEITAARGALERTKRRIRLRNVSIAAACASALLLFFLSTWLGFPYLPPRLRVESYAVWLTDAFDHDALSDRLTTVIMDSSEYAGFIQPPQSLRTAHAQVINRLVEAGAKTIALNIRLADARPDDDSLAAALQRAKDAQVPVVIGIDSLRGGAPAIAPRFAALVRWGHACVGDEQRHSAKMLPLVIAGAAPGSPRIHSLALESFAAFTSAGINDALDVRHEIRLLTPDSVIRVAISETVIATADDARCRTMAAGDTLAEHFVEYSPLAELRGKAHRVSYGDVLQGRVPLSTFRNRLVLLALEQHAPTFEVRRGLGSIEQRYGHELLTDELNLLLSGKTLRPMAGWAQFGMMLLMAAAGAAGAAWSRLKSLRWRLLWCGVAAIAYLGVAAALYSRQHLLLNTMYHLASLVVSFLAVLLIRRRWFA